MTDGEFDQMASWTVEAIERLGRDHAIPGACRGSGGPAAMAWLSTWLVRPGATPFLDLGGGLGGPSAWLSDQHDLRPVVAEPMLAAVEGARRLFHGCALQADGVALPFADATFGAAWCLGVLSTAPDRRGLLHELARVVRPGGRIGLVAYLATGSTSITEPEGNHFPTGSEFAAGLAHAGLRVQSAIGLDDLPDAGSEWDRRADAVDREIERHHASAPAWARSRAAEDHVAAMLEAGRIEGRAVRLDR